MPKRDRPTLPGLDDERARRVARLKRATDVGITALRRAGRLEPVDEPMIALARTLAEAADDEWTTHGSGFTVGTLSARLQSVWSDLRGVTRGPEDSEAIDVEFHAILAALRDTPRPGPSDTG